MRTGTLAFGVCLALVLPGCTFDPTVTDSRYYPCEDDGTCIRKDLCECIAGWCVPRRGSDAEDPSACAPDCTGEGEGECEAAPPCTYGVCEPPDCIFRPVAEGTTCDDGDGCSVGDSCAGGVCQPGPDGKDEDGDGQVDAACGGPDCDDENDRIFSGAREGPRGHATCSDGVDNDCDDLTDDEDPGCGPCETAVDCDDGNECTNDRCESSTGTCDYSNRAEGTPCDDLDACSLQDTCQDGVCVTGPTDKDEDTDGYLDASCQGGNDCDDEDPWVSPGALEGPGGDDSCDDGLDNDCDDLTDMADPGCAVCQTDGDGDGYIATDCGGDDCDDGNANVHPSAGEHLEGIVDACIDFVDNDCDGLTDGSDPGCTFLPVTGQACSLDGWCWQNPLPQGNDLNGVWVDIDGNMFAVGAAGTFVWWDGSELQAQTGFPDSDLNGVWGDTDILVVVGNSGTLMSREAWGAWMFPTSDFPEDLHAVWGSADDDIWAVGEAGLVLHRGAGDWEEGRLSPASPVLGVGGSSGADVWAVGPYSTHHYDGVNWEEPVGILWSFQDVWGTPDGTFRAVGDSGIAAIWDGSTWLEEATPNDDHLFGVWGDPGGVFWAVGNNGLVLYRTAMEPWWPLPDAPAWSLRDVGGSAWDDLWVVGTHGTIAHLQYFNWIVPPAASREDLNDVWVSSSGEIWIVGRKGTILFSDGGPWQRQSSGTNVDLHGVWGASPADVWAVGDNGAVLHFDGTTWSPDDFPSPPHRLEGISGTGPYDVWVVGEQGTILHKDTGGWEAATIDGITENLHAVWAHDANNAYIVGDLGTFLIWSGSTWLPAPMGSVHNYLDVHGTGPENVWLVTDTSVVEKWDGGMPMTIETTRSGIEAVWVRPNGNVFLAGRNGLVIRVIASSPEFGLSGCANDLMAVSGNVNGVTAVGAGGTILHKAFP